MKDPLSKRGGFAADIRVISDVIATKIHMLNKTSDYGYFAFAMAGVALVMLVISNGLAVGGLPVFYPSVQTSLLEIGALVEETKREQFSIGPVLTILLAGFVAPISGYLLMTLGFRVVMTFGSLLLGAGMIVYSLADSLFMLYSAHVLFGLSLCFVGVVPASSLVSSWFVKRRGLVLGLVLTGTNLGWMLVTTMGTYLIPKQGWRAAVVTSSLLVWLILLPVSIFIVRGGRAKEEAVPENPVEGEEFTSALRSGRFWLLTISATLIFYCFFAIVQHFSTYMQTSTFGLTLTDYRDWLWEFAVATIIGKFALGFLADYTGARRMASYGAVMMLISTIIFWDVTVPKLSWFAWGFGFSFGGTFVVVQMAVAELFGRRHFPRILGALHFVQTIGAGFGIYVTAYITDLNNGDYTNAYKLLAPVMALTVVLLSLLVGFGKRSLVQNAEV